MPKIYTTQQKQHAVHVIEELGSVAAASRHLNIPERTLRDWQRAAQYLLILPLRDPISSYQGKPDAVNIEEIRDRLLVQIDQLTQDMPTDPRKAYFAALAIDRYLDQIRHLNYTIGVRPHQTHRRGES